jgi:Putative  PD-(D/E)XK family member, (DUF4420)
MTDLDQLRIAWTALASAPSSIGGHVATLALEDQIGNQSILLGADIDGDRHLLVPTPDGPVAEDVDSDAVQIRELELGVPSAIRYTDVVCGARALADVFDDLILAILRKIEAGSVDPSEACSEVLGQWRALLRPPPREALSVNQMAGLAAELQLAIDILRRDPERRLDLWRGPSSSRHDFRRGSDAIEVKATVKHGEPSAEIHGLEQLEVPEDGALHLAWVKLEQVPEGTITVAGLVENLRRLLGGSPALYARLTEAGWRPESAAENLTFEFRERHIYEVDGDFPRLTPAMLPGGLTPTGVSNVRYDVALDPRRALAEDEVEALLDRIAAAGP